MKNLIQNWFVLGWQARRLLRPSGFTLLETLIIIVVIGILFAIMAPGWNALTTTLRLNIAQDIVHQAIRDAQGNARRNRSVWQASFRELDGVVQWAVHPARVSPTAAYWNQLDPGIRLDPETSLRLAGGVHRVQFDQEGNVNGQLGRLTLSGKSGGRTRRCVIVSTLIGAVRIGQDRASPQDGRFCW